MILVKNEPAEKEYEFAPQTLYKSNEFYKNGNIYLIVGPGETTRHVAALRVAGSTYEYSESILKSALVPFNGELVIKND